MTPDDRAPAHARRFVHDLSNDLPDELVADAELLVTELVTNAVRHGRADITVQIDIDPPRMTVSVTDHGAMLPPTEIARPPDGAAAGRGLLIVAALSHSWGVSPLNHGKTVWFELDASEYEQSTRRT